jgi:predicted amidophosphoribosyltransferase
MNQMPIFINEVIELLFPSVCITCGNRLISQENYLCMDCWLDLPESRFHLDPENKVVRLFWGRVAVENGTAYFQYRKGSRYQKLIHFIKYKGMKELGLNAGHRFGEVLLQSPASPKQILWFQCRFTAVSRPAADTTKANGLQWELQKQ